MGGNLSQYVANDIDGSINILLQHTRFKQMGRYQASAELCDELIFWFRCALAGKQMKEWKSQRNLRLNKYQRCVEKLEYVEY